MKYLFFFLILLMLINCGDNSPFDEDYWDTGSVDEQGEERSDNGRFVSNLLPTSSLSFSSGSAALDLDGNSTFVRIEMNGVPQNVVQGQISVISNACSTLVATPPTTGTLETKNYVYEENGTRAGLFQDTTGSDSLEGKSLVVFAFSLGSGGVANSTVFPVACGAITRAGAATTDTTATTGAGGTTTGITGTVTGGTVGGTTVGGTEDTTTGGLGEFSDGGEF